jgi:hypothetical protein
VRIPGAHAPGMRTRPGVRLPGHQHSPVAGPRYGAAGYLCRGSLLRPRTIAPKEPGVGPGLAGSFKG